MRPAASKRMPLQSAWDRIMMLDHVTFSLLKMLRAFGVRTGSAITTNDTRHKSYMGSYYRHLIKRDLKW